MLDDDLATRELHPLPILIDASSSLMLHAGQDWEGHGCTSRQAV